MDQIKKASKALTNRGSRVLKNEIYSTTASYEILICEPFDKEQVFIDYQPKMYSHSYTKKEMSNIEKIWKENKILASEKGTILYNSKIFRLHSFKQVEYDNKKILILNLGETYYKIYSALRNRQDIASYPDPIGTHIILVTSDNYIPLVKRSPFLDVNPGRIFTIGGFFDYELDWNKDKSSPDPFHCIQRETLEEFGLEIKEAAIKFLGIIYDKETPHPELSFAVRIEKSKEELKNQAHNEEGTNLFFVKVEELAQFLSETRDINITPTLLGGLRIFNKFGTCCVDRNIIY